MTSDTAAQRAPGLVSALDLTGRRVLIASGGAQVLGALTQVLAVGAVVDVVADVVVDAVRDLVERGLVSWQERAPAADDVQGAWLVVGGHDTPREVFVAADDAHVLTVSTGIRASQAGAQVHGPVGGPGKVTLVGGGPGDPGLLTVRGRECVLAADVVVVDRLAPLAVLAELPSHVQVVDVSKIPRGAFTPQERINEILVEHALAGRRVVRLKGGDSFVFGRGMEEAIACHAVGIEVEVVPGVTSAVAAPELAGIPVTHRGVVQGFAVVSGHAAPDDPRSTVDWAALAGSGLTLVVLMGVETLPAIAEVLMRAGREGSTPVACVMDAGLPSQRSVVRTVADVAAPGGVDGIGAPAVTIIGDVASFAAATRLGQVPAGRAS